MKTNEKEFKLFASAKSLGILLKDMTLSECSGDKSVLLAVDKFANFSRYATFCVAILFGLLMLAGIFFDEAHSLDVFRFPPLSLLDIKKKFSLGDLMVLTFVVLFILVLLCLFIIFFEGFRKSWLRYNKRYNMFLDAFVWYSRKDRRFLVRLFSFTVPVLEFGLIQYSHQWRILKWKMFFWFAPFASICVAFNIKLGAEVD